MDNIIPDIEYKTWHVSVREFPIDGDISATICSKNGYCVAVKPQYMPLEQWKLVAEYICKMHNKRF